MADQSCANCLMYRNGECHAEAPKPFLVGQSTQNVWEAIWPPVPPEQWCGQWKALPVVQVMEEESHG